MYWTDSKHSCDMGVDQPKNINPFYSLILQKIEESKSEVSDDRYYINKK